MQRKLSGDLLFILIMYIIKKGNGEKVLWGVKKLSMACLVMLSYSSVSFSQSIMEGSDSTSSSIVFDYPAKSAFVSEDIKYGLLGANLKIPNPRVFKTVRVSNAKELAAAITRFNEGESIKIKLTSDIGISSGLDVNNKDKILIIQGKGHCIYPTGGIEYTPQGWIGNYAYCAFKGPDNGSLVSEYGELVRKGKSKVYEALSPVYNEDGSLSTNAEGIKKVRIPAELISSMSAFKEDDRVSIYYTVGYEKKNEYVIKIKGDFLYFNHAVTSFDPNADFNKFGRYIAFQILNHDDGEGYYIRDNKLYYPAKHGKLYNPSFIGGLFNIENTNGTVAFYNITLKSRGPYQYNVINTVNTGTIIIKKCRIVDVYTGLYDNSTQPGGAIYIDNCYYENVDCFGVYPGLNSAYITNNLCYNVGTCAYNHGQCLRAGAGVSYIGYNELVNYGYCGIIASNTTCVVEHNTLKYTDDYFEYAKTFLPEDGGAIYTGQKNNNLIIRYNKIINYTGRFHNCGIYLDDGANNTKVVGNIIENVPNYYSIYARDDGRTEDGRNTGRLVAYNIMDNSIMLRGSQHVTPNNTFLGYNIICSKAQTIPSHIGFLTGRETQFVTPDVSLRDGVVISEHDFSEWIK